MPLQRCPSRYGACLGWLAPDLSFLPSLARSLFDGERELPTKAIYRRPVLGYYAARTVLFAILP